jgi:hypothetical protein
MAEKVEAGSPRAAEIDKTAATGKPRVRIRRKRDREILSCQVRLAKFP